MSLARSFKVNRYLMVANVTLMICLIGLLVWDWALGSNSETLEANRLVLKDEQGNPSIILQGDAKNTLITLNDQYGNVRGSLVQKMLADLNAYGGYSVATQPTKAPKRKYFWIGGSYGASKGIYTKRAGSAVPMFVAVSTTPTYGKRFRWKELANTYSKQRLEYHAKRAIAQAIRRRK